LSAIPWKRTPKREHRKQEARGEDKKKEHRREEVIEV
jgi:hypothetical protein